MPTKLLHFLQCVLWFFSLFFVHYTFKGEPGLFCVLNFVELFMNQLWPNPCSEKSKFWSASIKWAASTPQVSSCHLGCGLFLVGAKKLLQVENTASSWMNSTHPPPPLGWTWEHVCDQLLLLHADRQCYHCPSTLTQTPPSLSPLITSLLFSLFLHLDTPAGCVVVVVQVCLWGVLPCSALLLWALVLTQWSVDLWFVGHCMRRRFFFSRSRFVWVCLCLRLLFSLLVFFVPFLPSSLIRPQSRWWDEMIVSNTPNATPSSFSR